MMIQEVEVENGRVMHRLDHMALDHLLLVELDLNENHFMMNRFIKIHLQVCLYTNILLRSCLQNDKNNFNIFIVADTSGRKRLVLAPRTIQDPINAIAESSKSSSIYGGAKPREEKINTDDK